MKNLTRDEKLHLRKEMETKFADILSDPAHAEYDDIRFACMAPGVDLAQFNWHPAVLVDEYRQSQKIVGVENLGICPICQHGFHTCECHP